MKCDHVASTQQNMNSHNDRENKHAKAVGEVRNYEGFDVLSWDSNACVWLGLNVSLRRPTHDYICRDLYPTGFRVRGVGSDMVHIHESGRRPTSTNWDSARL